MFSSVNTCWTLVGAFLVYFMQAGFALCEAGFTRAKNTGNILMKNMMDFCIGTPCYWLIGFGLMFGGTGALIGGFDPFIQGDYSHLGLDIPLWVYIVFQTVFCATAATIVSGSMAERTNFKAYCVYSAAISLVVYPICGHWMWGGGWLQSMGFHDFAGSAAVHNVGGVIALLGAWMLGPRIGKYDKDGNPPRHPRSQPDRRCSGCVHPVVLLVRLQRRLFPEPVHRCHYDPDRSGLLQHQPCRSRCYLRDHDLHLAALR